MSSEKYIGDELALFEHATNWKKYYGSFIRPYLKHTVLEVGAGIGGTTKHLCADLPIEKWMCIEPDIALFSQIENAIRQRELPEFCTGFHGLLSQLNPKDAAANAILYIDVIEHIQDDKAELNVAAQFLKPGGHLIILVPAHQFLFSPFDEAIGHFRRYTRSQVAEALPHGLSVVENKYLDSVGYSASLMQKIFLKQKYPKLSQVKMWDRLMIPMSKITDAILGYNFGKSVLLIAQKN